MRNDPVTRYGHRVRIVGIMSGTSHDGIDAAVADLRLDGDTLRLTAEGALSTPYQPELRAAVAAVLPPAATTVGEVCRLDNALGQAYAEAAARAIAECAAGPADLVVCHGQTVFHWVERGQARGTLQLGAPAWIARRTGVPVLSDLRGADIAAGGQGAPLVPVFDALLLADGGDRPRAALNLGGIANLTVVRPGAPPVGYDAGPANALIDAAAGRLFGEPSDVDGRHAAAGRPDGALLDAFLTEPYYAAPPPKSTGKERFHAGYLDAALRRRGPVAADDVLATLTELTARIVAAECDRHGVVEVVAAGGGVRNPELMRRLRERGAGRWTLRTCDELGVPAQAKEAYAFALLGWLSWHGVPGALPSVTGARTAAVLGSWTPGVTPTGVATPPQVTRPPRMPRRLRVGGP
jgi:anhydro-N-acetylmuramic acid kinase